MFTFASPLSLTEMGDGNCFLLLPHHFLTIHRWIMVSMYLTWKNNRTNAIFRSCHPREQGLEGVLRDPGFGRNRARDSGIQEKSSRDS